MTASRKTASSDLVQVARDARGVATITLNDPARFNALGGEMLAALQEAIDALAQDESLRVVVLAAAGKAFCAGHNLKDMASTPSWTGTSSFLRSARASCFRCTSCPCR